MKPRTRRLLLIVLLVVVIDLPPAHVAWTQWRLGHSGTTVSAPADVAGEARDRSVQVTLPDQVAQALGDDGGDDGLVQQRVTLEQAPYDEAVRTGQVAVTYLEADPATYRIEDEDRGAFLATVLLGNAALLLVVGLYLLVRGRTRPELRIRATEDLARTGPEPLLERIEGTLYRVCGDIAEMSDDELVLEVGERRIRVDLDGHANPAGYQQSVRVIGIMVG